MASPTLFGQLVMWIQGVLLAHNTQINTELVSDDTEVDTIPLGYAGLSPSPDKRRITASNATPIAGEDFPFEAAKKNRTLLTFKMQYLGSLQSCVCKGHITEVSRASSVGAASNVDFTAVAEPAIFQ